MIDKVTLDEPTVPVAVVPELGEAKAQAWPDGDVNVRLNGFPDARLLSTVNALFELMTALAELSVSVIVKEVPMARPLTATPTE